MRSWHRLRQWWRTVFRSARVEQELHDELADWVETLAERHRVAGASPADAERLARIELGGVEQTKEHARSLRNGSQLESIGGDVRHGWRILWRAPTVTCAVILTFALGVGANAAVFTIVKSVLIEPLPYREPARLMLIWADLTDLGYPRAPLAGPELADFAAQSRTIESLGGIWATTSTLSGTGDPEQLRIATVTPAFFDTLGVSAWRGRTLTRDDFGVTTRRVLLSYALWQRRFGGHDDVIGQRITLNGQQAEVIGVMPQHFTVLMPNDAAVPPDLQAWIPGSGQPMAEPRGQQYLRVVARIRPGFSLADAAREIGDIGAAIVRSSSDYTPGYRFFAVPMLDDAVRDVKAPLLSLLCGVALLLVIACVNVSGLLIVRAAGRQRETAIRLALGAGQGRLTRQYVIEGLWLAVLGGCGRAAGGRRRRTLTRGCGSTFNSACHQRIARHHSVCRQSRGVDGVRGAVLAVATHRGVESARTASAAVAHIDAD